ncbi:MAG: Crp/Fnr family transcriptional regulator [Balneolaceae bacterium]|nr:Crp/Fnr family transcriptional regulator [Balneolaceae bacterium]
MTDDFSGVFTLLAESDFATKHINEDRAVELSEGEELLNIGSPINVVPFVLSGTVRVMREDSEGHELYLYHIQRGESCAMTLNSTLSREYSRVKAVTLEKTKLLAVPVQKIRDWYESDPVFRTFVLKTYQQRFDELLDTLDQVAFEQIDRRLIRLLKERSEVMERKILKITHQELADELNSSREVISRLLKQMEKKGMVELGRNRIKIIELM